MTLTDDARGPRALLLEAREVPLGGVRAMSVRRSLPQRELPMIGAWCFLDRFGPQDVRMRVEPHPHIGLQTVTWPLVGEIRHRDAVGSDVVLRPGQLNLMTSGEGIAHSEYSVGEDPIPLDALQLWVALPETRRHGAPDFERHEQLPVVPIPAVSGSEGEASIVLGELAGVRSPATVYTPLVGAEVRIPAGSRLRLPLHPGWEYAVAGVFGDVVVRAGEATPVTGTSLLYLGTGRDAVEIESASEATVFLLGGEPFEADIVMWWNFVGRTHDEIVAAREEWERSAPRFGPVVGHGPERVPAPPLPAVRLTPRRRRG
ncbi:pirin family protein [Microbacterium sp. RD1]|uniref:pirin family protein n=1 Tax=Microbacterium sp. RD1 TaxID=3457313 RepID=UPI003FA6130A